MKEAMFRFILWCKLFVVVTTSAIYHFLACPAKLIKYDLSHYNNADKYICDLVCCNM